ncbi:MAG: YdiY family protein [Gammaproteobacteria bacterium]
MSISVSAAEIERDALELPPILHDEAHYVGQIELDLLSVRGNLNYADYHGLTKIVREKERWRTSGTFEGVLSKDEGVTIDKSFEVKGKLDYFFSDPAYFYLLLNYLDNDYSNFEKTTDGIIGHGYQILNSEKKQLQLEAGLGIKHVNDTFDQITTDENVFRLALDYSDQLNENTEFFNSLEIEIGEGSTISQFDLWLQVGILKNLAIKLAYALTHESKVPDYLRHTDFETTVAIVYQFQSVD